MARIQILALTPKTIGEFTETPFVLVIDQADEDVFSNEMMIDLKAQIGAASVILHTGDLTVENVIELSDEAREALEQRITAALVHA